MHLRSLTASAVFVFLAACGGGGGSGGAPEGSSGGTPSTGDQPAPGGGTPPASDGGTPPASGGGTPPSGDGGGGNPPPSSGGTPPSSGDGGSGGGGSPPSGGDTPPPSGDDPPPPVQEPPPDPPTPAPPSDSFRVDSVSAPANGATISDRVWMGLQGKGLQNAELLPPSGYVPKYVGFFPPPKSLRGEELIGVLNTRLLANGRSYTFRISAFDVPAGTAGAREIVAMQPRTWTVSNGLNWRKGDRFAVPYPGIYPLSYDHLYLRNWLAVSNEQHAAASDQEWEAFLTKMETYVPHHIDFESGPQAVQTERRDCFDNRTIPSCRSYVTALIRWIES